MYACHNFTTQNVLLREADVNNDYHLMKQMCAAWARDYRAAGDTCNTSKAILDNMFGEEKVKLCIAEVLGEVVGFVFMQNFTDVNTIDIVYVLPRFRRNGYAAQIYKLSIEEFGVEQISLSYKRAITKLDYWRTVGFQSIKGKAGQGYKLVSLCYLSVHSHVHSISAVPLKKEAVAAYRKSLGSTWEYKADWIL